MRRLDSKGFTIIELLIATLSFSLVLLIITGAIIQFSKIYYQGTIKTKTQETARIVIEDISKKVQYTKKDFTKMVAATSGQYCIGDRRYSYNLDTKVDPSTKKHALVADSSSCSSTNGPATGPLGSGQTEMLGEGMHLLKFNIREYANGADIELIIGYGDDIKSDNTCPAINLGGGFCAVSGLSTTVVKRLKT